MIVIGVDLSGPSNHQDTVLAIFNKKGNQLAFQKLLKNCGDQDILDEITAQSQIDDVIIGMDAPLSYQDGGGDRVSDKLLRAFIVSLGMKSGSIMPPTFNRMVYLTLRGIKLTREIEQLHTHYPVSIVEVHPGAVMGSRVNQSEMDLVRTYKQNIEARVALRLWMETQDLMKLPTTVADESHTLDACAAALGAWHWKDPSFEPKWLFPAQPPLHPYDFCC